MIQTNLLGVHVVPTDPNRPGIHAGEIRGVWVDQNEVYFLLQINDGTFLEVGSRTVREE